MRSLPSLKRYLAGSVTVIVFAVAVILYGWPRSGNESTAQVQPAKSGLASWPMFGGGPARNMVNLGAKNAPVKWVDDDGDIIKETVLWKADLGSRAYGGPMVAGGKVFVGTNNQAPRDLKYKTVKTLVGDVVKKVDGKAVKDVLDIQEIVAPFPLAKELNCTVVRDGKEQELTLSVIPTDLGVLMAFDQTNGKFQYQTIFRKLPNGQVCDWPLEGLCSTPTADGDRIYYTSNRCEVICANINTGEIDWKLDMMKELGVFPHNLTASCPLIVGDDLYLVTANGVDEGHINVPAPTAPSFLKLNKKTHEVLWQNNWPTIKLTQVAKGAQADFFKKLINAGELIQHGQWSNPAYGVVDGQEQIVWPGGDGWIYSFDPSGKLLWKFDCNPKDARYELAGKGTRSDFIATPVIYKDHVYIGVGQDPEHLKGVGHLWCIAMNKRGDVSPELVTDASVFPPKTKENPNSAKVWQHGGFLKAPRSGRNFEFGRTMSTCAIHDDLVYAADLSGILYCLDAKKGTVLWDHDTGSDIWSSPYWADGKIYLGTDAGDVWVFAHGKDKNLLAKNEMGKAVRASPVVVGDILYVISGKTLYAIKNK